MAVAEHEARLEQHPGRNDQIPTHASSGAVPPPLRGLPPAVLDAAMAGLAAAERAGIPTSISRYGGFRTAAMQRALYAHRGENPNPVAKPGESQHERGMAMDVASGGGLKEQAKLAKILAPFGWKWAGPVDPVHFDYAGPAGAGDPPAGPGIPEPIDPVAPHPQDFTASAPAPGSLEIADAPAGGLSILDNLQRGKRAAPDRHAAPAREPAPAGGLSILDNLQRGKRAAPDRHAAPAREPAPAAAAPPPAVAEQPLWKRAIHGAESFAENVPRYGSNFYQNMPQFAASAIKQNLNDTAVRAGRNMLRNDPNPWLHAYEKQSTLHELGKDVAKLNPLTAPVQVSVYAEALKDVPQWWNMPHASGSRVDLSLGSKADRFLRASIDAVIDIAISAGASLSQQKMVSWGAGALTGGLGAVASEAAAAPGEIAEVGRFKTAVLKLGHVLKQLGMRPQEFIKEIAGGPLARYAEQHPQLEHLLTWAERTLEEESGETVGRKALAHGLNIAKRTAESTIVQLPALWATDDPLRALAHYAAAAGETEGFLTGVGFVGRDVLGAVSKKLDSEVYDWASGSIGRRKRVLKDLKRLFPDEEKRRAAVQLIDTRAKLFSSTLGRIYHAAERAGIVKAGTADEAIAAHKPAPVRDDLTPGMERFARLFLGEKEDLHSLNTNQMTALLQRASHAVQTGKLPSPGEAAAPPASPAALNFTKPARPSKSSTMPPKPVPPRPTTLQPAEMWRGSEEAKLARLKGRHDQAVAWLDQNAPEWRRKPLSPRSGRAKQYREDYHQRLRTVQESAPAIARLESKKAAAQLHPVAHGARPQVAGRPASLKQQFLSEAHTRAPAGIDAPAVAQNFHTLRHAKTGQPLTIVGFRQEGHSTHIPNTGGFYAAAPERAASYFLARRAGAVPPGMTIEEFGRLGGPPETLTVERVTLDNPLVVEGGHHQVVAALGNRISVRDLAAIQSALTIVKQKGTRGYPILDKAIAKAVRDAGYDGLVYRWPGEERNWEVADLREVEPSAPRAEGNAAISVPTAGHYGNYTREELARMPKAQFERVMAHHFPGGPLNPAQERERAGILKYRKAHEAVARLKAETAAEREQHLKHHAGLIHGIKHHAGHPIRHKLNALQFGAEAGQGGPEPPGGEGERGPNGLNAEEQSELARTAEGKQARAGQRGHEEPTVKGLLPLAVESMHDVAPDAIARLSEAAAKGEPAETTARRVVSDVLNRDLTRRGPGGRVIRVPAARFTPGHPPAGTTVVQSPGAGALNGTAVTAPVTAVIRQKDALARAMQSMSSVWKQGMIMGSVSAFKEKGIADWMISNIALADRGAKGLTANDIGGASKAVLAYMRTHQTSDPDLQALLTHTDAAHARGQALGPWMTGPPAGAARGIARTAASAAQQALRWTPAMVGRLELAMKLALAKKLRKTATFANDPVGAAQTAQQIIGDWSHTPGFAKALDRYGFTPFLAIQIRNLPIILHGVFRQPGAVAPFIYIPNALGHALNEYEQSGAPGAPPPPGSVQMPGFYDKDGRPEFFRENPLLVNPVSRIGGSVSGLGGPFAAAFGALTGLDVGASLLKKKPVPLSEEGESPALQWADKTDYLKKHLLPKPERVFEELQAARNGNAETMFGNPKTVKDVVADYLAGETLSANESPQQRAARRSALRQGAFAKAAGRQFGADITYYDQHPDAVPYADEMQDIKSARAARYLVKKSFAYLAALETTQEFSQKERMARVRETAGWTAALIHRAQELAKAETTER